MDFSSIKSSRNCSPYIFGKSLFGSETDVTMSASGMKGELNESRLSTNDTLQCPLTPELHTPETCCRCGIFSPSEEAAWSAAVTEISSEQPRSVRRKMSTEDNQNSDSSMPLEDQDGSSRSIFDFQMHKKPRSPDAKDEFLNRKALFQSRRSEPSFLKQKDFTPILLQRTGKQPSKLSFDGHYRFIEVIGRGNFGEVWKAEHHSTKELYAIKKSTRRFRSSKERDGHLREITSVAKLDPHENLVRYFRAWQASSRGRAVTAP